MKEIKALTMLMLGSLAQGCSCVGMEPKEALRVYDYVFAGKIRSIQYIDEPGAVAPRVVIKFDVLKLWKGATVGEIVMHTRRRDGRCEGVPDYQLRMDETLLVYAIRTSTRDWNYQEGLTTDACSRTQLLREATKDLRVLGKPYHR